MDHFSNIDQQILVEMIRMYTVQGSVPSGFKPHDSNWFIINFHLLVGS